MKVKTWTKIIDVIASLALLSTMFVIAPCASAQNAQPQVTVDVQAVTQEENNGGSDSSALSDDKENASKQEVSDVLKGSTGEQKSQEPDKVTSKQNQSQNIDIYANDLPKGIEVNESKAGTEVLLANADAETNALYLYDIAEKISQGDKNLAQADITLNASPNMKGLEEDQTWIPIGTQENPYTGVFDGNGNAISNLEVSGNCYLGLFGCIGAGGKVKNVTIRNAHVTAQGSTDVTRCVGVVAGYAYGAIGSDQYVFENVKVVNCTIDVKNTMPVANAELTMQEDPFKTIESGKINDGMAVENIGGIVGYCAGNIKNCTLTGDNDETSLISVEVRQAPKAGYSTIGKNVGGIAGQAGGFIITHKIKDKAGETKLALEPQYPNGNMNYSHNAAVGKIVECSTEDATIKVVADGKGADDRFGNETSSYFDSIGGIVGYGMTDITSCRNKATLDAPQGDGVGGIVGNLRALVYSGTSPATSDAGCYKADGEDRLGSEHALTVFRCTNDAAVKGLHAVGGIEGGGGTYTAIKECANLSTGEEKQVIGMRWNKPMPGGIAGQTYGDIVRCYNHAIVTSDTRAGFYVAGIVGATARFSISNGDQLDSPAPEVAACYSKGAIYSGSAYKEGGICGSNEGYIHDCYYLTGMTQNGLAVAESGLGTVKESTVKDISSDDLKKATPLLNACLKTKDYQDSDVSYYMSTDDSYPQLSWQSNAQQTDISNLDITQSGTGQASYTTAQNPVPVLTLAFNGKTLVQNEDFYVLPDENALNEGGKCKDVYGENSIANTTFKAKIVGIGAYCGTNRAEFSYTVGKGDFAECAVIIKSKPYNAKVQWIDEAVDANGEGDLIVKDGTGEIIDRNCYVFPTKPVRFVKKGNEKVLQEDPSEVKNYKVTNSQNSYDGKAHAGYQVQIVANKQSNYQGAAYGFFVISKEHLLGNAFYYVEAANDPDGTYALLDCNGKKFYFEPGSVADAKTEARLYSLDEDGNKVYGMSVPYLGEAYTANLLKVNALYLKDGDSPSYRLIRGKDFSVVYGDPADPTDVIEKDTADANLNVTSDEPGKRACITVRYIDSNDCNFTNYANLFFTITKANIATQCSVSVANNYTYTGKMPSVVVRGMTGAVIPSSNYIVTCSSSTYGPGTVKVTVTGKNNLEGSITKTVTVKAPTVSKVSKISKITPSKKKAKVSWKGVSGATGYRIAYKVKGSGKWKYTTTSSKSKTIKGLKKGKKYSFKVQAYKKIGSKYFYGKYCSTKTSKKIK